MSEFPRSADPAPSLRGKRVLVVAPLQDGSAWQQRGGGQAVDFWTETILHQAETAASALEGALICQPVWPADVATFDAALGQALETHRPDAVAIVNLHTGDEAWVRASAARLDCLRQPCLYVSMVAAPATFPYLTYDQRHAGFYAAKHLMSLGYRRVVYLDLGSASWVADRLSGARDACPTAAFTAVRPADYGDMTLLQGDDRAPARRAIAACLAAAEAAGDLAWDGSTAIIAPADEFALLVLDLIEATGRRPGYDLGVIGFDDLPVGRSRGLSTIRPPLSAYGRELVQVLARGLAHGAELHQRRLTPELIARSSTARRPEVTS